MGPRIQFRLIREKKLNKKKTFLNELQIYHKNLIFKQFHEKISLVLYIQCE